jgi:Mg-chelatase subunit ChlD
MVGLPILAVGVAAVAVAAAAVARAMPPRGRLRPLVFSSAALFVLGAAGIFIGRSLPGAEVLLIDVSWSTGMGLPDCAAVARDSGLNESDMRVVLFGAVPVALAPGATATEADLDRAGRDRTDLASGLRAAAAIAGAGGRITMVTDGRVDFDEVRREATRVLLAGTVLALRPMGTARADPRVVGIQVPGRVAPGAALPVGATVAGPPGADLSVEFRLDGHAVAAEELVVPPSGRLSARAVLAPPGAGWHEVAVAILRAAGAPGNDVAAAGVVVAGPPRARVVNAPGLTESLRARGYEVMEGEGDEPLFALDLLVLRDVPVTRLARSGEAVREYVAAGGGLLLLGGPHSFGPGGYSGRAVEDCLPVRSDADREGTLVIVLLDASGTMREPFAGAFGPKLLAARGAVSRLLACLPDDAWFLLVPFTAAPLPAGAPIALGDPGGRERAAAVIGAVVDGRGGTALAPPLRLAGSTAREVARTHPGRRCLVILVTDGRLEEEAADAVLAAAAEPRRAGARLEVLSVGSDADREFLSRLSGAAQRVVEVGSGGDLEQAFLDAWLSAEGEGKVRSGSMVVRRGPGRGPDGPASLPGVNGLVRTWARADAEVLWVAGADLPVVAHGRHGMGRSAVVTTDPLGDWAPGWAGTGLLAELSDFVRRPAPLSGPRAEVRRDGSSLLLSASVAASAAELRGVLEAPGRSPCPLVLHAIAPGRFEGRVRLDARGAARLTLAGGGVVFDGGVSLPGPAEFGESGPDPAGLSRLSALLTEPAGPVRREVDASAFVALAGLALLLADRALKSRAPRRR